MTFEHITFTTQDQVGVITLSRPDHMNAFSGQMGREIQDAYRICDTDDDIRVVVLTGQGRAFCAGADFSGGSGVFGAQDENPSFDSDPFDFHAWDVRKPVIVAINGHAVGIGLTMTLHADIRIISTTAKCGILQNRRGVMPDLRAHWALPRLVGHARAAELLLTGRMFSGAEAAEYGIAVEAHEPADVLPRAMELAREIAVNVAPVSVAVSKHLLWLDPAPSHEEINVLETRLHLHLMGREDAKEGVMAFLEKRDPQWQLNLSDDWPSWLREEASP